MWASCHARVAGCSGADCVGQHGGGGHFLRLAKLSQSPGAPGLNISLNGGPRGISREFRNISIIQPNFGFLIKMESGNSRAIVEKSETIQNFKSSQTGLAYSGKS